MVSFERKVENYIAEHQLIEHGDRLLIACSGGIDSMGLLHFFLKFQQRYKIEIFVSHVDHMLRGETSAQDRVFVEEFCKKHNIPVFSTAIPIPKILEEEGGNSQAVCRRERYGFFAEVMENKQINKLVTAHHADDQLESVLMSITRAGSIKGMKAKREFSFGSIIRPFFGVTKSEVWEYLEGVKGTYREDASNAKDDYTRNRFRHHIVPLLKEENNNIALNAVQLVENTQQDDEFLFQLAKERFSQIVNKEEELSFSFSINTLQKEPVALQRRIILILLNYLYSNTNISQSHTMGNAILQLCNTQEGSAMIHLPEQIVAKRHYSKVTLFKERNVKSKISTLSINLNKWNELQSGIHLYIGNASYVVNTHFKNVDAYYFDSTTVRPPFFVRTRKEGDRIALKGMTEEKRLSRLFIDEKVPLDQRDQWPLLVNSNDEVIAVLGIRFNNKFSKKLRSNDDMIVLIGRNN